MFAESLPELVFVMLLVKLLKRCWCAKMHGIRCCVVAAGVLEMDRRQVMRCGLEGTVMV